MSTKEERREKLQAIITDEVTNLLYYDRKEDEDLGVGDIEGMILCGDVTVDEMISWYEAPLRKHLTNREVIRVVSEKKDLKR